jgi:hypothetical protein
LGLRGRAGSNDRQSLYQLLIKPFFNDSFSKGWYLTASPIITSNGEAANGVVQWMVSIGDGFGGAFAIVEQNVNASLQAFWNVVKAEGPGDWTRREQFQFLFPR